MPVRLRLPQSFAAVLADLEDADRTVSMIVQIESADAVEQVDASRAGVPIGVNAFDPAMARRYLDAGVSFILVGADVMLLARGSETFADQFGNERTRR